MIDVKFEEGINDLTTENLYQWDTYQTLKISGIDFGGVTPKVHFANKKSTVALVVSGVFTDDGGVKVSIPNSLLAEKYDILAYVYTNTGLTCKTIKSITIPIISRLKPSEYTQPTDEDIAQIEAIELEAKVIIDGLTASEYSSTEKYKRPNIVYYELGSYMCKSNTEITGVLPTDTTKWQKLAQGIRITGISVNDDGYLVITCNDGASFNIGFRTKNVTTVNSTDFPALGITKDSNGVLRLGDTIIPQKVLLWSGSQEIESGGYFVWNNLNAQEGSRIEIIFTLSATYESKIIYYNYDTLTRIIGFCSSGSGQTGDLVQEYKFAGQIDIDIYGGMKIENFSPKKMTILKIFEVIE